MHNICAVVVTFNRKELLLECLDALLQQTYSLNKIYLIDNNSNDGTEALLDAKGYLENPQIVYEKLDDNIGGAGGFSYGLQKAYKNTHEFYYLLDDDAEPKDDAIEQIIPYLDHKYSAFASAVYNNFGLQETTHRGNFDVDNIYPTPQKALALSCYQENSIPIDMASFVGILIPHTSIQNIGFPRAEFFIHFDDTEYCMRLCKIAKIALIPHSIIYHKEKRQEEKIEKKFLWFRKNRIRYDKLWIKYFGKRNSIYLAQKYTSSKVKLYTKIFLEYITLLKDILLFDDHKLIRIKFSTSSYIDGLFGKFDNVKPKEIISVSPFLHSIKLLNHKKIYLAPYNTLSLEFEKSIHETKNISFITYLDNYHPLYSYQDLDIKNFDYIVIASPNHYQQIYAKFIQKGIPASHILYLSKDEAHDTFLLSTHKIFYALHNKYAILKHLLHANYYKLFLYQNKHHGKRAFILGNGPSLNISDLDMLKDEITFAANKIYLSFNETLWRPTYYFVEDNLVYLQNYEKIANLHLTKFFTTRLADAKPKIKDGIYFNLKYENFYPKMPHFGINPLYDIYWGSTIIYTMIQFAIYMGIKEIYIIGLDFNFNVPLNQINNQEIICNGEVNHFHKEYRKPGEKWNTPNLHLQQKAFEKVQQYCHDNNIKIYNASKKTELNVFEKISFETLFQK